MRVTCWLCTQVENWSLVGNVRVRLLNLEACRCTDDHTGQPMTRWQASKVKEKALHKMGVSGGWYHCKALFATEVLRHALSKRGPGCGGKDSGGSSASKWRQIMWPSATNSRSLATVNRLSANASKCSKSRICRQEVAFAKF